MPVLSTVEMEQEQDSLADHLPNRTATFHTRRELIYSEAPEGVYLVVTGLVVVERELRGGRTAAMDIYKAGDFFGEAGLLEDSASGRCLEFARVLSAPGADIMHWPATEVLTRMRSNPGLLYAIWELGAKRTAEYVDRLEALHTNVRDRLITELLRLSGKLGDSAGEAGVTLPALSHETLAALIGTSRELVTNLMGGFRRKGLLRYSRTDGIFIRPDKLRAEL